MADNIIRFGSRTFSEIKEDIIAYIKQAYPEIINDFSDSSVGSILIDINAGVANNLAITTDRLFQETQLEYAQQKSSLLNIAKNLGLNIPSKRPSITLVDITVTIPVLGNKPDESYYPVLQTGAQIIGGGQIFETIYNVDWSSPYSGLGNPNRKIVPVTNSNGAIVNYLVTKRELVINGKTNIYRRAILASDVVPFFSIILPDENVIGIESVLLLENNSDYPEINQFYGNENRYYEVEYLAQQRIFVEDNKSLQNSSKDIKVGRWMDVTKKFIKEYTPNGYCKLIFGAGDTDNNLFSNGSFINGVDNGAFLKNFLNNMALGEKLKANHTLFVRYRTGGGANSNMGVNSLTNFGVYNLIVNGARSDINNAVKRSITVTNPIPAIGGNDGMSIEQIRNYIKYNFSSQNRVVTLNDYLVQIFKMPGRFGSPFRANAYKLNNKVVISILGLDEFGKLSNTSNSILKENIAEYLSQYRMINDYIEIKDGKIFNLALDVEVYVNNVSNNTTIINNIVNTIIKFFDIYTHGMNEDIFMGQLQTEILKINGVNNILKIVAYNKVGGKYSLNAIAQPIVNTNTGEIALINNTIYSEPDSMFEIKYPDSDIKVVLRKKV